MTNQNNITIIANAGYIVQREKIVKTRSEAFKIFNRKLEYIAIFFPKTELYQIKGSNVVGRGILELLDILKNNTQ